MSYWWEKLIFLSFFFNLLLSCWWLLLDLVIIGRARLLNKIQTKATIWNICTTYKRNEITLIWIPGPIVGVYLPSRSSVWTLKWNGLVKLEIETEGNDPSCTELKTMPQIRSTQVDPSAWIAGLTPLVAHGIETQSVLQLVPTLLPSLPWPVIHISFPFQISH